jgi:hypothetical protein
LIYPDGSKGFQVNCGVRIHGNSSRTPSKTPKRSFRLVFREIHGPKKLNYDFFEGSPVDEFDSLILRAGYNDSWIHYNSNYRRRAVWARDMFARKVQLRMGHAASHGNFAHLYVNGLYWGIYNPSERPDANFTSAHLGGKQEDWDATNSGDFKDGDSTVWNQLMELANDGLGGLAAYDEFQTMCDVENLADYMIINHYIGNQDWDHRNWYAARRRRAGEGYKFFCWDSERSLSVTTVDETGTNNNYKPSRLFAAASANPEFRLLMADRLHKHLFNDGPLTVTNSIAIWQELSDITDRVLVAESARWGDWRTNDSPYVKYTMNEHYYPEQTRLLTEYFPYRRDVFIDQYKALGLYPDLEPPTFSVHGGTFSNSTTVTISGPTNVYYTTDGSDPREYGTGLVAGLTNSGPVLLVYTCVIKARSYDGAEWSALTETAFIDTAPSPLRITEIMCSPRSPDATESLTNANASAYCFIEIANTGSEPVGLAGIVFSEGIRFDFTKGSVSTLNPGEYAVVVKDWDAFLARYPGLESVIAGEYLAELSQSGEQLKLELDGIHSIVSFSDNDARDWPIAAQGAGHSLVPRNESAEGSLLDYGRNWRASLNVDGSPGASDASVENQLCINEIAGQPNPAGFF